MSEEGGKEEEMEPFTMITKEDVAGASAGLLGSFSTGKTWIQKKHAGVRPWSEFFNLRYVSRPKGSGDAIKRILSNVARFQSNYLFVFLGLMVYCIVTNPVLLFALAFCVAVWWLMAIKNKGENIKLLGRETSAMEMYMVVGVIMIPVLYFAGAGSTVFWIIGASVVVVLVHAIFILVPADSTTTSDPELGGIILEDVTIS
jgi:hypothetical protein